MTSKKAMLSARRLMPHWMPRLVALGAMCLVGCGSSRFVEPSTDRSPYPNPKVWAVLPLANESTSQTANGVRLAEQLAQHLRQVEGLDALPIGRAVNTLQAAGLTKVETEHEANQAIRLLKVDGILVGSVTAWDPYDPPKIGASIRLYAKPLTAGEKDGSSPTGLDYRRLMTATTAFQVPGVDTSGKPKFVAKVSGHLNGADGRILNRLKDYANGRTPDKSPSGWRRYLISMDLYSEFVGHELIRRLFALEWDHQPPAKKTADSPR